MPTSEAQLSAIYNWRSRPGKWEMQKEINRNGYHNEETIHCEYCDRSYKKRIYRKHVLTDKHIQNEINALPPVMQHEIFP